VKLLIIDDDPDIRDVLSVFLEAEGFAVVTAADGLEGLEKIKAENPDLIILDMLMPKLDGYGVCKTLQDPRWSKWSKIPIVVLTSVREEASRRRYELETGVRMAIEDYVEKPLNPDTLLERVNNILARQQG
jgi:DNA-binding response OmpR family regulator